METTLATVPSQELLHRLKMLVRRDRAAEAELLVHLGEVDARKLFLEQACSSMFVYCTRVLHFAEGVAYKRIQVARAARRIPVLLDAIRCGDLHVTAASLLVPHLTPGNADELIRAARRRTAEQVRVLLADRSPAPEVQSTVRRIAAPAPSQAPTEVPAPTTAPSARPEPPPASAPAPAPPRAEPLGGERYCIRFTADREAWQELQELRALMRHQVPDGDMAKILKQAVSVLLARVRKQTLGECARPRAPQPPRRGGAASRHIPAPIRCEVYHRDGGRCTFRSSDGSRCDSREFLEFHHVDPWASSRSHPVEGITLRCRAHNQHQAERDFGARHMARFRNEVASLI